MTVEYFEVIASSANQDEDAGWYFQRIIDGVDVGEPVGPFATKETAEANLVMATA